MLFDEIPLEYFLPADWQDPEPAPVLEQHNGFWVVRDDLLGVGSKVRFVDYWIKSCRANEIVFGSCPATGYAQISLPHVCSKYGKKAVLFMAKRSMDKLHEYQKRGMALGAEYHWVENGMLPVTQKRAKDYVAADPNNRVLLPIGLEHPTVLASIMKIAKNLPIVPDEFWTVGSSGTINRGLQAAWPEAAANVVSVGHNMTPEQIGRATYYRSEYKFDKPTKILPPFPSAPTYDAKCWEFMLKYAKTGALFWNVGA